MKHILMALALVTCLVSFALAEIEKETPLVLSTATSGEVTDLNIMPARISIVRADGVMVDGTFVQDERTLHMEILPIGHQFIREHKDAVTINDIVTLLEGYADADTDVKLQAWKDAALQWILSIDPEYDLGV